MMFPKWATRTMNCRTAGGVATWYCCALRACHHGVTHGLLQWFCCPPRVDPVGKIRLGMRGFSGAQIHIVPCCVVPYSAGLWGLRSRCAALQGPAMAMSALALAISR
jgi:hypothetical protein